MRILITGYGVDATDSPLRSQVADPLRFLGHEVVAVAPTEAAIRWGLDRYSPEILVVVPSAGVPDRSKVRSLTAESGTVALCLHTGPSLIGVPTDLRELADDIREYDLVTVPDRQTLDDYALLGTFRLSLMEPAVHPPAVLESVSSDRKGFMVVGDADPENVDVVMGLDHLDDIVVMGRGWAELPLNVSVVEPLPLPDRGTLFAGASFVVELPPPLMHQSAVGRAPYELGLSSATYEAAVVGTPSVVQERPAVSQVFNPNTEVITYKSLKDLHQLLPVLLSDVAELEKVGEAAWSRVTAEHTWSRRWRSLLETWVVDPQVGIDEEVRYLGRSDALTRAS